MNHFFAYFYWGVCILLQFIAWLGFTAHKDDPLGNKLKYPFIFFAISVLMFFCSPSFL